MKKIFIVAGCIAAAVVMLVSCDRPRRSPGAAYMPDMTYSRAYETYTPGQERLNSSGAHYNGMPVPGTIARGELMPYKVPNDSTGYNTLSAAVKNPLDSAAINLKEAERLYLVNCAICHGTNLDGNGPLYNNGNGPYAAAPANLMSDDMKKKSEGTMYHVATYGKGQMGSYASQLSSTQRWMVVAYIKSKQGGGKEPASADSTSAAKQTPPTTDSTTNATGN
jgi:mono/diheme cytochrome c family protein